MASQWLRATKPQDLLPSSSSPQRTMAGTFSTRADATDRGHRELETRQSTLHPRSSAPSPYPYPYRCMSGNHHNNMTYATTYLHPRRHTTRPSSWLDPPYGPWCLRRWRAAGSSLMHPKDLLQERLSTTSHIGHRGNLHWPENSDRRYPDINYSLVVAQHNNIMVAVSQYEPAWKKKMMMSHSPGWFVC